MRKGSAWAPVILPVFKTGGRPSRATVCSTHTHFRHLPSTSRQTGTGVRVQMDALEIRGVVLPVRMRTSRTLPKDVRADPGLFHGCRAHSQSSLRMSAGRKDSECGPHKDDT